MKPYRLRIVFLIISQDGRRSDHALIEPHYMLTKKLCRKKYIKLYYMSELRRYMTEGQLRQAIHDHQSELIDANDQIGTYLSGGIISGGRRRKGVRHCIREVMEPSGVRRCAKYARG